MRKCSVFYGTLLALVLVSLGVKADNNGNENVRHSGKTSEYTVAAYIWPSCHLMTRWDRKYYGQRRRVSGRSSRKVIPGFRGITSLRFPYGVMSWITIPR